jgi:heme exporter protein C
VGVRAWRLSSLALTAAALLATGMSLVFSYAPVDIDQGFLPQIFSIHVPMAIVALCGFTAAGGMAIRHLRTGDRRWDLRAYVAIHLSIVFAVGVLLTGAIWARASWGHWWVWNEPALVSFLIVFLLYCTYPPLRFAIEDPERQARYASVFAIVAGAFVPVNFLVVRLAQAYTHPRVLGSTGGNMPAAMRLTFVVCLGGVALLFVTLWRLELIAKDAAARTRRLHRARQLPSARPAPVAQRHVRAKIPQVLP